MTTTLESLLSSAPPGQLDGLVDNISTLSPVPADLVDKIKANSTVSSEICNQELAQSLKQEWTAYQKEYYCNNNVDYTFSITGDQPKSLVLSTLAQRIDVKNCHAGSWRGAWTIAMSDDGSAATLQGSIHIHIYCHEDCNVQLESKKEYNDLNVVQGKGGNLAKSIKNKIATVEANVAAELEEMYDSMDDKLKALRRILPIMRKRLDWNVLSHRMVKKLEETAASN
eukprot:CAMPEP_0119030014 /NCGR_PEP_ID=MMETSP1176-20130426/40816_1 /TAXON_ID=265551 /ORGANISM="Synedropsis recta cf, Strain CCMP1620" /LENGTH=225 /DNA_ID=CAMNT_0006986377 /DNA_START=12 /DNA_END=689 /DNA_ORIENTATION=+